jgi:branched-subunit amino acid transport protein
MLIDVLIIGMAAVVFFNRYLFLEPRLPFNLGPASREFLSFAVPGVLTAICGPIIFMPDQHVNLSLLNPYLLGAISAVGLMLWSKRVLTSMLLSLCVFYLLRALS